MVKNPDYDLWAYGFLADMKLNMPVSKPEAMCLILNRQAVSIGLAWYPWALIISYKGIVTFNKLIRVIIIAIVIIIPLLYTSKIS